jgi:O-antigen ligase
VSSTESRIEMLKQSVAITFAHPLFGIGPNQFPVYTDQLAKEAGFRRGNWQVTHNTYTQISSECGIPALLFYAVAMILAVRAGSSLRRNAAFQAHPAWKEISKMSFYLRLSLVAIAVFAFFLSFAYTALFYMMAGLVVAFERTALLELSRPVEARAAVAAPAARPALAFHPQS